MASPTTMQATQRLQRSINKMQAQAAKRRAPRRPLATTLASIDCSDVVPAEVEELARKWGWGRR